MFCTSLHFYNLKTLHPTCYACSNHNQRKYSNHRGLPDFFSNRHAHTNFQSDHERVREKERMRARERKTKTPTKPRKNTQKTQKHKNTKKNKHKNQQTGVRYMHIIHINYMGVRVGSGDSKQARKHKQQQ